MSADLFRMSRVRDHFSNQQISQLFFHQLSFSQLASPSLPVKPSRLQAAKILKSLALGP